jgi:hypothetical protein
MTLSMLYLRLTLLSAFAVLVLICISYAHSSSYEHTTIATLKDSPGVTNTCISSSGQATTRNREIKTSSLEKSCDN